MVAVLILVISVVAVVVLVVAGLLLLRSGSSPSPEPDSNPLDVEIVAVEPEKIVEVIKERDEAIKARLQPMPPELRVAIAPPAEEVSEERPEEPQDLPVPPQVVKSAQEAPRHSRRLWRPLRRPQTPLRRPSRLGMPWHPDFPVPPPRSHVSALRGRLTPRIRLPLRISRGRSGTSSQPRHHRIAPAPRRPDR